MVVRLVVIGILTRLVGLSLFDPSTPGGDTPSFLAWAAHQPPGYPLVLSLFGVWGAMALQSVGTIAVALLTLKRVGPLPAFLIATSPFFVVYEFMAQSDTLGLQLTFAAFLLIAYRKHPWEPALAGLLLGLAILIRDTYQYLPLFALPFALIAGKGRSMAVAAALALLVLLPWQLAHQRVSISEGRMGYNLWIGTWERNGDWMLPGLADANYPSNAFVSEAQRDHLLSAPLLSPISDARFKRAAIDRITTDPLFVLSNWSARYPRLWLGTRSDQIEWRLDRGSPLWTAIKVSLYLLNLTVLALGFLGMILAGRGRALLIAPVLYLALVYIPFHNTEPRYTLGALPFLYIFAAEPLRRAWRRLWRQRSSGDQAMGDHPRLDRID